MSATTMQEEVNENTPLLQADREPVNDGTIERPPGGDDGGDDTETPLAKEYSLWHLSLTMGSIWVGVLLAALDTSIVATLAGPISTSFNSFTLFSWVATAYIIANAAVQPLSGRLTDIFGRRAGLVASNIFFAAGTLMCGLARETWVIILGRVIAGVGGGGMFAISTFIASDLVPLRQRGLWQGLGNICYAVGGGLGGVFGGWINDIWGWRNAFLIQVPLIVVSGILVFFAVHIPVKEKNKSRIKRVDFLGATALISSLVLLLVGLNAGGNIVEWTHPLVLSSIPLSAAALALFVYVEAYIATEPIIPVRLLLNRTVLSACLTNWFVSMSIFSIVYYGPVYFQIRGYSTTKAGQPLIPQAVGAGIGSLGSGLIMRSTGRYAFLNIGIAAVLVTAGVLFATTINLTSPIWPLFVYFFLGGLGYGGMLTVTLLALISAVDHVHQAVITSASYAFRSTGSTLGITISSAVFQNILKRQLWKRFGDYDNAAEVIGRIRDSIDEVNHLPSGWHGGVMDSYMVAMRAVWITAAGLGILGASMSLLMRENILHKNLERR